MFCICVLIIAAAAVYMVEAYMLIILITTRKLSGFALVVEDGD